MVTTLYQSVIVSIWKLIKRHKIGTEMVPETSLIFNQSTWLVVIEDFINDNNIAEGNSFPILCSISVLTVLLFLVPLCKCSYSALNWAELIITVITLHCAYINLLGGLVTCWTTHINCRRNIDERHKKYPTWNFSYSMYMWRINASGCHTLHF
jgi:hypothetical protein